MKEFLNTTSIDLLSPLYKSINFVGNSTIPSLGAIMGSQDKSLSILLAKASFAFLLISMLFYWFQTTFKYDKKTLMGNVPHLTMWCANLTLALLLFVRWFESGHFPLSNLYESLIFLSWSLTTIHLVLEDLLKKRKESTFSLTLGAITSPVALFTNAFATFSLPQEMQKVTVLVPALQSNWLMMHVSVMIISYAALLSGSLLAVAFLAIKLIDDKQNNEMSNLLPGGRKGLSTKLSNFFAFFSVPLRGTGRKATQSSFGGVINEIDRKEDKKELSNTFFPPSYGRGAQGNWLSKQQDLSVVRSKALQTSPPTEERGKKLIESDININIPSFSTTSLKVVKRGKKPMITTNKEFFSPKPLLTSNSLTELPPKGVRNWQLLEPASKNNTKSIDYINNKSATSIKTTPIELDSFWKNSILPQETTSVPSSTTLFEEDLLQILDNLSYRAIGLGFALLTIGILSGAVWANEAWGSYWSWDPKETWAFFTWLIFALYLHMRLSKGWVGKESAFVASFGFAVIWFCYLGVNLFGKGLHSYGWFH